MGTTIVFLFLFSSFQAEAEGISKSFASREQLRDEEALSLVRLPTLPSVVYNSDEDWPCTDCLFQAPDGVDVDAPTPLIVTFHGDENSPNYIHRSYQKPASNAGYYLLSLKCPEDRGCPSGGGNTGTWSQWAREDDEHVEWVDQQVQEVEKKYNVDPKRIYLSGFSAGSFFMGRFTTKDAVAKRFAAGVWQGGGTGGGPCNETCKMPAYFLLGAEDRLIENARKNYDYLVKCEHEAVWDEVEGVKHSIAKDRLPNVFEWLDEHPHQCLGDDDDDDNDDDDDDSAESEAETGDDADSDNASAESSETDSATETKETNDEDGQQSSNSDQENSSKSGGDSPSSKGRDGGCSVHRFHARGRDRSENLPLPRDGLLGPLLIGFGYWVKRKRY